MNLAPRLHSKARQRYGSSAADVALMHGGPESTPQSRLAAEVLYLAIEDARKGRDDGRALRFLQGATPRDLHGLEFWCDVVGIDPDVITQNLDRALASGSRRKMKTNRKPIAAEAAT